MQSRISVLLSMILISILLSACGSDGGDIPSTGPGGGNNTCNITDTFTPGGSIKVTINGISQIGTWMPVSGTYRIDTIIKPGKVVEYIAFDNYTNVTPAPEVKIQVFLEAESNCQLASMLINISTSLNTISCPNLNECPGITLDKSNGQVIFNNASIPNAINPLLSPAIVNGTLTW